MSKQGTAGKRKHLTLTIQQKLEIIWRIEYDGSLREVMAKCKTGCDTEKRG